MAVRRWAAAVAAAALVLAVVMAGVHGVSAAAEKHTVTCGSVVKLTHVSTSFKLHSHEIPYGTGSGQQSVTAFPNPDDLNSYWVVKGVHGKACRHGQPIRCGSKVRLVHKSTGRNLHSHLHQSPLSHQQEVSAFGNDAGGDTGDSWTVECSDTFWQQGSIVRLQHVDTEMYLSSSAQHRYQNPIAGQQEVSCAQGRSSNTQWMADEGFYMPVRKRVVVGGIVDAGAGAGAGDGDAE